MHFKLTPNGAHTHTHTPQLLRLLHLKSALKRSPCQSQQSPLETHLNGCGIRGVCVTLRSFYCFTPFSPALSISLSLFFQPVAMHLTPCGRNNCLKTVKKQEREREKEEPKAREAFSNCTRCSALLRGLLLSVAFHLLYHFSLCHGWRCIVWPGERERESETGCEREGSKL